MNKRTFILTGRALRGRLIRTMLTIWGIAAMSVLTASLDSEAGQIFKES